MFDDSPVLQEDAKYIFPGERDLYIENKIKRKAVGIVMKFPIKKELSFEKKVKLTPGEYFSEIIEAKTPEGYTEDAAIQLTYALRNEPNGEIVAKKSEIIPFTSDRWYDFEDMLLNAGLNIDDTDDLIGIREKQTYKKVAGSNGYCYTNIVQRELIEVDET